MRSEERQLGVKPLDGDPQAEGKRRQAAGGKWSMAGGTWVGVLRVSWRGMFETKEIRRS